MALKVSLRKANAIQTNINDLLKAINVKTSVEISEFQEPTVVLQSANDAMAMTVRDFVAKCKEIDPLVCMGIESFIEKNKTSLEAQPMAPQMSMAPPEDITFSNAIAQPAPAAPAPAQNFSLDQSPEDLSFAKI